MKEQVVARAYAKAIMNIGEKKKNNISKELLSFSHVMENCSNLRHVIYSGMFTMEEKVDVCKSVLKKMKLSTTFGDFISFLLQEKRMPLYSLILNEALKLDDEAKGVVHGYIEGVEASVGNDVKKKLVDYMEGYLKKKVILDYLTNNKITSGYRIVVEDLQLDASVDRQLDIFKESLLEGERM